MTCFDRASSSFTCALAGALILIASVTGCDHRRDARLLPTPAQAKPSVVPAATTAPSASAGEPALPSLSPGARTEDERNSVDVFRLAAPSTVFVTQSKIVVNPFAGTATEVPAGSGSGFIWDDAGHVVTNFHVIRGAESVQVTLEDQSSYPAKVVGVEPRKDIAVLALEAPKEKLVPIRLSSKPQQLEVGQKTVAIGNPFGLDHTMTVGIVSALGREVQGIGGVTIRDMIQTDAAINPGNSGGPLLDSSAQLIGMNTMIFSRSGSSAGIGFAVPESVIRRVVPQIIEHGKARQVGLGIQIDPAQRVERRLRIPGVVVLSVVPGSPADKAGMKGIQSSQRGISLGDVIVGIDDHQVSNYDDLYNALDRYEVGAEVTVKVLREGETVTTRVPLIEIP